MDNGNCPLCGQTAENHSNENDLYEDRWECQTCGRFRISAESERKLRDSDLSGRRFLLSAYSREGTDVLIDEDLLSRLGRGTLRERTVLEKTELILRWFADKSTEYGLEVTHEPQHHYPMAWCRSSGEWTRIVTMLARERGHLKAGTSGSFCKVTDDGWNWLARKPREESLATAFVAMNFATAYDDLRKAIVNAITNAGYRPIVISSDLYSGGIMDRVLARIREARFVVADFSGNRGGVYYEAGFALGMGKTVIHSCSKEQLDSTDQKERLHFDVAHLKMIPWTADHLDHYSEEIENHILAVLGRGPDRAS